MAGWPHLVAGFEFATLPQQLVNGILLGAIYALIALGYTMVYGVLRLINFAHGEVFMLGAYAALLTSWAMGFGSQAATSAQGTVITLVVMILVAMTACALIGVVIERFAYRPMRNQPRIAALITAIGVSLFIQFAGQLFLPVSPPPAIDERVNPYRGTIGITLRAAPSELEARLAESEKEYAAARTTWDAYLAQPGVDRFNLPPDGRAVREVFQTAERAERAAQAEVNKARVMLNIPEGQLIMLVTAVVLMLLLRQLVLFTRTGRAMRAVSHDFDSASLMGINVNRTVTVTFLIGSALAGAGGMMLATFQGTTLSSFFGVQPGVKAFIAAVLGGIGNIPGAVLGGLLMGVAETLVVWGGGSAYKDAVAFIILIAVLLLRPGGLLGSSKVEKV